MEQRLTDVQQVHPKIEVQNSSTLELHTLLMSVSYHFSLRKRKDL